MALSRDSAAEENIAPPFISTGSIEGISGQPPPQFECPICLHWLQEPVITSCGHRFCKSCITVWLQQGGNCPVDNVNLRNVDLFPDNYTRREILQQSLVCPFASNGCNVQKIGPMELDNHLAVCTFRKLPSTPSPKTTKISCPFKDLGCKLLSKNEEQLTSHLDTNIQAHLNLLMAAYSKLNIDKEVENACANSKEHEAMTLWDPSEKQNDSVVAQSSNRGNSEQSVQGLIRALYERVVILEQRNHEQNITVGNLSRLLTTTSNSYRQLTEDLTLKYCFGTYVWKIENFNAKLDILLKDRTKMLYSQGFYSSPNGYRFCARLNASPNQNNNLALHIHMMKTANDDCLDWPFMGKISLTLINPTFPQLSQKDTMDARPDLAAFQKPTTDMSTRGFGFVSYISADDIKLKGFVSSDCLKIRINIQYIPQNNQS